VPPTKKPRLRCLMSARSVACIKLDDLAKGMRE
jgi:hypothetical protein